MQRKSDQHFVTKCYDIVTITIPNPTPPILPVTGSVRRGDAEMTLFPNPTPPVPAPSVTPPTDCKVL